jgi:HSP20 family protein
MSNLVVRQPSLPMLDPLQLFQHMLSWDPMGRAVSYQPDFEVRETPDHYQFRADVPGLEEADIDITLTGHQLTISGLRQAEERREGETYYLVERRYGSFSRSFQLPEGAHLDDVSAELRHGVLTVTVPKRPEVKPRKISIRGMVDRLKKLGSGDKAST